MLSYTERRSLFGDLSNNTASATLTMADRLINIEEKRIESEEKEQEYNSFMKQIGSKNRIKMGELTREK